MTFGGPAPHTDIRGDQYKLAVVAKYDVVAINVHVGHQHILQRNHGNKVNTNFLCGQENVWKWRSLRADW